MLLNLVSSSWNVVPGLYWFYEASDHNIYPCTYYTYKRGLSHGTLWNIKLCRWSHGAVISFGLSWFVTLWCHKLHNAFGTVAKYTKMQNGSWYRHFPQNWTEWSSCSHLPHLGHLFLICNSINHFSRFYWRYKIFAIFDVDRDADSNHKQMSGAFFIFLSCLHQVVITHFYFYSFDLKNELGSGVVVAVLESSICLGSRQKQYWT